MERGNGVAYILTKSPAKKTPISLNANIRVCGALVFFLHNWNCRILSFVPFCLHFSIAQQTIDCNVHDWNTRVDTKHHANATNTSMDDNKNERKQNIHFVFCVMCIVSFKCAVCVHWHGCCCCCNYAAATIWASQYFSFTTKELLLPIFLSVLAQFISFFSLHHHHHHHRCQLCSGGSI